MKLFDNVLTRAQVALEAALPPNSQVDALDLSEDEPGMVRVVASFPYGRETVEIRTHVPFHLIYDHARLIAVVLHEIEGWIIEMNDHNEQMDYDPAYYTFPDVDTIVQRLETVDNSGGVLDRCYTMYAKKVAHQRVYEHDVFGMLFAMLGKGKEKTKTTRREEIHFNKFLRRKDEIYRALFCDAPDFAERVVSWHHGMRKDPRYAWLDKIDNEQGDAR